MLDSYYCLDKKIKFDELFSGLYIHDYPTVNRNSYYILRFNFSGIETKDFETVMNGFLIKVRDGVENFINRYELEFKMDSSSSPVEVLSSLLRNFEALKRDEKVYVLIDEYDHFTNSVLNNGMEDFVTLVKRGGMVRSFYEVIKESTETGAIARFFATGVMSVSLDSLTSGFNIASNISTNPEFADMMGFNTDEVKEILNQIGLTPSQKEDIYHIWKENYNGYLFSKNSATKVFNSTLIMYYLKEFLPYQTEVEDLVDPNLNQSSHVINGLVNLKNKENNYRVIEEIIKHKVVSGRLSRFVDISKKYDKSDFITLLYSIGLLTIKEPGILTKFEMPNKIIEAIYFEFLGELFHTKYNYGIDVEDQENAIMELGEEGKIDALTKLVQDFLHHISGRNAINFDEQDIKLSYLRLLFPTDQFHVYDEFPAKQGFADLILVKSSTSYSKYEYLIELKHVKKGDKDERVQEKYDEALKQISDYMTDNRLSMRENLKKFIVVFKGFEVAILEEID
jgi:hypothetical protein